MPREGTSKSGQGLSGLGRVAFDYDSRGIADFAFQRPASFHDIKADFSPLVVATNDPSFHRPFAAQNLRHLASIPSVGILDDGAGIRFSLGLGFGAALGAAPFPPNDRRPRRVVCRRIHASPRNDAHFRFGQHSHSAFSLRFPANIRGLQRPRPKPSAFGVRFKANIAPPRERTALTRPIFFSPVRPTALATFAIH